jgi:hypothetical protein
MGQLRNHLALLRHGEHLPRPLTRDDTYVTAHGEHIAPALVAPVIRRLTLLKRRPDPQVCVRLNRLGKPVGEQFLPGLGRDVPGTHPQAE